VAEIKITVALHKGLVEWLQGVSPEFKSQYRKKRLT
jgi:hypothetical protein